MIYRKALHIATGTLLLATTAAFAGDQNQFSSGSTFEAASGETLFRSICQGCHMPDALGAQGAGHYPDLAGNPRLASPQYPLHVVTNGQGGMPAFKRYLDDQQIAEVVNYVRSHFGNQYTDVVTSDDVKTFSQR